MRYCFPLNQILRVTVIVSLSIYSSSLVGQTIDEEKTYSHSLSLGVGHTMVAKGVEKGEGKWLTLPSWAVDYNYRINTKWGVALQNEIILSDFEVETTDGENVIARTTPFASVAVLGYYPWKDVMVFMGAGAEVAKEESFVLLRLGAEPSWEIGERFGLVLGITYDFKIEGYDSFGLSLGVEYKF